MKIAWLFSVFMMWMPVVGMADIVRLSDGSDEWIADKICAEMDQNNEMYCLCNKNYDIKPPEITGVATTDRRTYVSDEEWQSRFPYKHILAVVNDDGAFCTANIVRGKIVTAAHCVEEYGLQPGGRFNVQDAYGRQITATLEEARLDDGKPGHDWAILQPDIDLSNVSISKISEWPIKNPGNKQIYLSGFGALKIMNDAEIQRFQKAYVEFLKAFYSNEQKYIDTVASQGVRLLGTNAAATMGKAFIDDLVLSNWCRSIQDNENLHTDFMKLCTDQGRFRSTGFNYAACGLEYKDIFRDSARMKSSICNATDAKSLSGKEGKIEVAKCQSWGGNSGGGFYLSDRSILGVFDANIRQVGGDDGHAGGGRNTGTLMQTFEKKLPAGDPDNDNPSGDDNPGNDNPSGNDNHDNNNHGKDRSNDLPKLFSKCKDEDLPDNAISGYYRADAHSNKKCLVAEGREVGCTCGASECAENYRKVGSAAEARCVLVNSSAVDNDKDKKLVGNGTNDTPTDTSTRDNSAGSGGNGTGSGQTRDTSSNPTEAVVGEECLSEHLPMGATRGIYITYGNNIYTCRGNKKCACAAMECDTDAGYTLVRDARGNNMGWCRKQQRR